MESIVLGGGCFWCLDAGFRLINGVNKVEAGYAGGKTPDPSYWEVAMGKTGHAEVVRVTFDPVIIKLADIPDIFWAMHNPTTLNYQGNDVGTEYRSTILYDSDKQYTVIKKSLKSVAKLWSDPIVTEVAKLDRFYLAEEEHQDYFTKHSDQAYCQVVINPKLAKLRKKFTARLK